ncbi:MAG TPA: PASTA domain-containing protein [Solirubrobacterales bacterium]|jgi:serine/threonine-protein kinase|nr:PASTA domain-containing protein [Solirubrobacterales bacterium]HNO96981.1 PASTA domain-containing protein [Solirubrobacterales bacterium]
MRLSEGMVVDGRYRIDYLIGSGGMADVWLAEDLELPRRVALKVLHERYARDPEFIARFRREAESAASLQHVNIVSIFDRGQVGDTYYIAMAYLEGRTLRDLISLGLTPPESVAIVRQILEAAGFAHRRGIVHRDFKPLNVIVDETGLATVTDFGIARAGISEITEEGSIMGTVHYLSPEQAQGYEVSPQSDLYSIGVILYECLTGRVPFDGQTPVAVTLQQLKEDPVPPSSYNRAVSPALDAVVLRALQREPYERYPDAESFIAALDAAEADPGVPEEKSNWWKWALVVLAVLIGLLIAWAATRSHTVEVPDVVGTSSDAAVSKLNQEGFKVEVDREKNPSVPNNQVYRQDPSGEADQDCNFLGFSCSNPTVTLTVSGGPGQTEVPDVTGLSQDDAEQELEDAGFTTSIETRTSSDVDSGLVIETDPAGGEMARRGSEVTVTVSSGAAQVKVPPVVGQTLNAAKQQLAAVGLDYSSSEEPSDRPQGEVIDQSPTAGTRVDPGSTVTLVVSSGPEDTRVSVPALVGQTQSSAESQLTAAGLVPSVQTQSTTIQPQDGKVIDQSPGSGTKVAEGSTVVITVGKYEPDSGTTGSDTGGIGID